MTADSLSAVNVAPTWFDVRGLVELAMHNTRQLIELQLDVWRALLETQGQASAPFGFPAVCGAVLCGGGPQRRWSRPCEAESAPWLAQAGPPRAVLEMQRQFGALLGDSRHLVAQGWQQAVAAAWPRPTRRCASGGRSRRQQVEELGDAAEAGRDALLDAADPASDPAACRGGARIAAGEKSQRRLAGERSRHGRAA
jgi:hypothetical protein